MITAIVISLIIGAAIGVTFVSCLNMAKNEEPQQPTAEPVKLLTVGSLVRWKADVGGTAYEIKKFDVDEDNQTVAAIESEGIGFIVPIEELEEVPDNA